MRYTPFDELDAGRTIALVWYTTGARRGQLELLAVVLRATAPEGTPPVLPL